MSWKGKDLITACGLGRKETEEILSSAEKMERGKETKTLSGKIHATVFYEPSTRTKLSFTSAMQKLGGSTIGFSDPKTTSEAKGETLRDAIKAIEGFADAIAIRHPSEGSAALAAEVSEIPVINAGDGNNQHPSQALVDLYTIKKARKEIDGTTILFAGDLKYGRTVHSLAYALSSFEDVTMQFYSPQQLKMPQYILADLRESVKIEEIGSLNLQKADVIYATRIQKERIADPEEYRKASYVIVSEKMKEAKGDAMPMHPLPRVDEIAKEVDNDKRAKYFEQERNEIPVRMALLSSILGE